MYVTFSVRYDNIVSCFYVLNNPDVPQVHIKLSCLTFLSNLFHSFGKQAYFNACLLLFCYLHFPWENKSNP
jgi:hypothetical protein